ncbi:hypothetical protein KDN24_06665 [Bacillus sp. Bva_UNVM-123]|uniref:hypothetical protein n=1 Tax=Bacillus sp. Bva_UNVM-123 TaxID=2829798 RepID=UPI00391FBF70
MINVYIEESGVNFSKNVGRMTPLQIEDFLRLIKDRRVMYSNEKYVYIDSYYDGMLGGFYIIVDIQD